MIIFNKILFHCLCCDITLLIFKNPIKQIFKIIETKETVLYKTFINDKNSKIEGYGDWDFNFSSFSTNHSLKDIFKYLTFDEGRFNDYLDSVSNNENIIKFKNWDEFFEFFGVEVLYQNKKTKYTWITNHIDKMPEQFEIFCNDGNEKLLFCQYNNNYFIFFYGTS
jgi:hypothetical protein